MVNKKEIKVSEKGYYELQKRINKKKGLNERHSKICQFVNGDAKMKLSNNAIRLKWHISRETIVKMRKYDI